MSLTLTLTAADGATSSVTLPDPPVQTLSVPVNVGETAILAAVDNGNGNLLLAQPITLGQAGTLQSLSFYVSTIGGELRLGLYSNASGKPGTKLAETNAFTPILGWNTQPPLTTPTLQPGPYWIAYLPQSNALGFKKTNAAGPACWYGSFIFGTMPTTFPTTTTNITTWSFYATFLEAPPTMPAPPAGLSAAAVSSSQINLSWTASAGATGYKVFRNGSQVGTSALTTYADIGLAPSTSYTYTIEATNSSGASAMSPASIEATFAVSLGGGGMVYPFPNALNTGVPGYPNTGTGANSAAAAALPTYSGPTTITTNGTTISGQQITSPLTIAANNVTIENCYVPINGDAIVMSLATVTATFNGTDVMTVTSTSGAPLLPGMQLDPNGATAFNDIPFGTSIVSQLTGTTGQTGTYQLSGTVPSGTITGFGIWPSGLLIAYCEFVDTGGTGNSDKAISFVAYCTITYCNIHGYFRCVDCSGSGVTVTYSYLWYVGTGGHIDTINCNGAGTNFNFSYNTIINEQDQTDCIFCTVNFGPVNNVTANGNFMIGGDYTFTALPWNPPSGPGVTNVFASNNSIGSGAVVGGFGYVSVGTYSLPATTWSNNCDYLTGQLLPNASNTPGPNTGAINIASFLSSNQTTEPCFTLDSSTFLLYQTTSLTFTLKGCCGAGDTVAIYQDGSNTPLGTTTANATTGIWTYTVTATAGVHYYVAKDTTASVQSLPFYVEVMA